MSHWPPEALLRDGEWPPDAAPSPLRLLDPRSMTLYDPSSELVSVAVNSDGSWTVENQGATAAAGADDAGAILWHAPLLNHRGRQVVADDLINDTFGCMGLGGIVVIDVETPPSNLTLGLWVLTGIGVLDSGGGLTANMGAGLVYTSGHHRPTLQTNSAQADSTGSGTATQTIVSPLDASYRRSVEGFDGGGLDNANRSLFAFTADSTNMTPINANVSSGDKLVRWVAVGMRSTGANQTVRFRPWVGTDYAALREVVEAVL